MDRVYKLCTLTRFNLFFLFPFIPLKLYHFMHPSVLRTNVCITTFTEIFDRIFSFTFTTRRRHASNDSYFYKFFSATKCECPCRRIFVILCHEIALLPVLLLPVLLLPLPLLWEYYETPVYRCYSYFCCHKISNPKIRREACLVQSLLSFAIVLNIYV